MERIGMIGDLFKSARERKQEQRRDRKRALRDVTRIVARLGADEVISRKEKDAAWSQAKMYWLAGDKAAAERSLYKVRDREAKLDTLAKKKWTLDRWLDQRQERHLDEEIVLALENLSRAPAEDIEVTGGRLSQVVLRMDDGGEMDTLWEETYNGEVGNAALADAKIPSVEEMMKLLDKEIEATKAVDSVGDERANGLVDEIAAARKRLADVLEHQNELQR